MKKKTAIIGATTNPDRYAYQAAEMLVQGGHEIIPIGIKSGEVFGKSILSIHDLPQVTGLDTITLYINAARQHEWEDYLLSLNPKRIIFNPGTENYALAQKAEQKNITTEMACTLVMLSVGNY
ncbi:MAG: CoA-binding protein [Cyclobacteriaceae bacterium]|nr:CoA-binding protein [Cyclobacteriaceae bacterium HetDA_MAG_MS6]